MILFYRLTERIDLRLRHGVPLVLRTLLLLRNRPPSCLDCPDRLDGTPGVLGGSTDGLGLSLIHI